MNELLLISELILIYGGVLVFYRFFGKAGLYSFSVLVTILANIEVLLVVNAFGMEQTLGNILFASTFVITDILSENHGKAAAKTAVYLSIAVSAIFILLSLIWINFVPSKNSFCYDAFITIFKNTPRVMLAGFVVFAAVQSLDVFLYHRIWKFTENKTGSKKRFLWLRNNAATIFSQAVNSALFNLLAFCGTYDKNTLISIIISTFLIYVITSLADTPIIYLARNIKKQS